MTEPQAEYLTDAQAMIGAGYKKENPVEVHLPSIVMEMRDGYTLEAVERGPWIKLSISFRDAIKNLKGAKLAVFISVALCINPKGESFPSLDTLAKWTGYSRRAVIDAVQELQVDGFLTVMKGKKKSNLYCVNAFASFGKEPASAKIAPVQKEAGTSAKNDTENAQNVLKIAPELESLTRTNNKNVVCENSISKNIPIDWKIVAGLLVTDEDLNPIEKQATDCFEISFGFGALPWSSNAIWQKFERFVVKVYKQNPTIFREYKDWRAGDGKYKAFSNRKIRENPQAFMDTGIPEFEASRMYRPKTQVPILVDADGMVESY